MIDFIRLSETDPLWMTLSLIFTRLVGVSIIIWWVVSMVRTNQGTTVWKHRSILWPWSLTGWMIAVATLLVSGIIRLLIVEHVRQQDAIGVGYRIFELLVAINFAIWSIVTFWRWLHPEKIINRAAVFDLLTQALPMIVSNHKGIIQDTTPKFDELVGAFPNELLGKPLETIMPERYVAGHDKGMERYMETREPHIIGTVVSIDMLKRDGEEIPVYLALNTAEVDGVPWYVAAIFPKPRKEPETLVSSFSDEVAETIDRTDVNVEEMKANIKELQNQMVVQEEKTDT